MTTRGTRATTMMRTVRFLTGLAMVVAGVSLAAPLATRLVEAHLAPAAGDAQASVDGAAVSAWGVAPGMAHPAPSPVLAPAAYPARAVQPSSNGGGSPADAGAYCIPDPRLTDGPVAPAEIAASQPRDVPAPFEPPPAPAALPTPPADLSLSPPPVDATYRSTLDAPPPPLLDVAAPVPLAVTTAMHVGPEAGAPAPGVVRTVSAEVAASDAAFPGSPTPIPASYVVRDGDDLTAIATRLYGHPGAAEAIWTANRDRLADPSLLPIGMALRIPPSWVPPAMRATGAGPAVIEPARRPAKVRVAPGETLESLAVRFYGDRAWAQRLWEANRDQLRSPALLVAGVELRLP